MSYNSHSSKLKSKEVTQWVKIYFSRGPNSYRIAKKNKNVVTILVSHSFVVKQIQSLDIYSHFAVKTI